MPALCVSSDSETFRRFCSAADEFADFFWIAWSRVPRKAATANATPHTSASAALSVVRPLPASPNRSPQTTDKLTNVTAAVTHFIELYQVPEWGPASMHRRQTLVVCPETTP